MNGQKANYPDQKAPAAHPYIDLHCDTLYLAWEKGAEDIFQMDGAMADVSGIIAGGCRLQVYAIFMPDEEIIWESGRRYEGDDAYIRSLLVEKYGKEVADEISILYGGSCKPSNAKELFACPDIDGGLIGGASLKAADFMGIVTAF